MIFLTILILALVALTACYPTGRQGERAMLAKLILCSALLYGLGLCWAAKLVLGYGNGKTFELPKNPR